MAEPFIGQIIMFGGSFAPRGWAFCDGQLLQVAQNSALFSILGTTYGGDGRSNFGLPDLRGRFPMHAGNGPGLSSRRIGDDGGREAVTLNANQIPAHTHSTQTDVTTRCQTGAGNVDSPGGKYPAGSSEGDNAYHGTDNGNMASDAVQVDVQVDAAGGGQSHDNLPPFQCVNFIIALTGVFPSRS